jgi:PAS domain S-box-containing protein
VVWISARAPDAGATPDAAATEEVPAARSRAAAPQQAVLTTAEREASADAHDARVVTLDALLLDVAEQRGRLMLVLRAGSVIFDADLPLGPGAAIPDLPRGSLVRLTGVSVARVDKPLERRTGFRLLLRGPADVIVRVRPPWWTLGRLFGVMGGLAGTFALVVVWVVILRRRVREQTEIIRAQLQHEVALDGATATCSRTPTTWCSRRTHRGRLVAINRAAEQLTGYRRAELLARSLYDFMPPERREPARRAVRPPPRRRGAPATLETAIVARDGRVVALEMAVRVALRHGKPCGIEGSRATCRRASAPRPSWRRPTSASWTCRDARAWPRSPPASPQRGERSTR